MKRLILIIAFLHLSFIPLFAQEPTSTKETNTPKRGIIFGADLDSLKFIVASPFDNWYLGFGGGLQTFIGNELYAQARKNQLDFQIYGEIGKWLIPDLSVSINARLFSVHGQSRYALEPFLDMNETPDDRGYRHFRANGLTLGGLVTIDWTNFFNGYEAGSRKKLHVMTPIGLGASMLFGKQTNEHNSSTAVGDFRFNFELYYTGGFLFEYLFTKELAFDFGLILTGSESTWDWSPYDNSYSRFDIMPMFTFGARINLLHQVVKRDLQTDVIYLDSVNHEFLAYGTKNTVKTLHERIDNLYTRIDSVINNSDAESLSNQNHIDSLKTELGRLQDELVEAQSNIQPMNPLEEIAIANEELNLPAVIVYFELDKYKLDYNARKRLQSFAKQVNANLEDTTIFYLLGAADSATGTERHNQWLSEHRCEAVYNVLVNNFGFNPNRFIVKPLGGITEYEPKEYNRVSMVILKTKETTDILEKWLKKQEEKKQAIKSLRE